MFSIFNSDRRKFRLLYEMEHINLKEMERKYDSLFGSEQFGERIYVDLLMLYSGFFTKEIRKSGVIDTYKNKNLIAYEVAMFCDVYFSYVFHNNNFRYGSHKEKNLSDFNSGKIAAIAYVNFLGGFDYWTSTARSKRYADTFAADDIPAAAMLFQSIIMSAKDEKEPKEVYDISLELNDKLFISVIAFVRTYLETGAQSIFNSINDSNIRFF